MIRITVNYILKTFWKDYLLSSGSFQYEIQELWDGQFQRLEWDHSSTASQLCDFEQSKNQIFHLPGEDNIGHTGVNEDCLRHNKLSLKAVCLIMSHQCNIERFHSCITSQKLHIISLSSQYLALALYKMRTVLSSH